MGLEAQNPFLALRYYVNGDLVALDAQQFERLLDCFVYTVAFGFHVIHIETSSRRFNLFLHAIDPVLLANGKNVVHQPVDGETGGKRYEHESEHQRHHEHHTPLIWISGARSNTLFDEDTHTSTN